MFLASISSLFLNIQKWKLSKPQRTTNAQKRRVKAVFLLRKVVFFLSKRTTFTLMSHFIFGRSSYVLVLVKFYKLSELNLVILFTLIPKLIDKVVFVAFVFIFW